jgi:hypothetical protein
LLDSEIVEKFSKHRLGGELVPMDLQILLLHQNELEQRTGIVLTLDEDWTPWLDTSYLSEAEKANPEIAANIRAIEEVCSMIAFVAVYEDDEYIGYWRGPDRRFVADSPLTYLDNEGQFYLCGGTNIAEAILARASGEEHFQELRDWMRSIGIDIHWDNCADISYPEDSLSPGDIHKELYKKIQGQ